jgi:hypothetical protein
MNATAPDDDQAEPEEEKSSDARRPLVVEPGKAVHLSSALHDVPRTGDLIWSEKHEKVFECGAVVWEPTANPKDGERDYVVEIRDPTLLQSLLRHPKQLPGLLRASRQKLSRQMWYKLRFAVTMVVALLVALVILMEIGKVLS